MLDYNVFTDRIFQLRKNDNEQFEDCALQLFYYQATNNPTYKEYLNILGKKSDEVSSVVDIPFMPIELFKTRTILSGNCDPKLSFESSGTTGQQRSIHHICDPSVYERSYLKTFENFYGAFSNYCVLALLPSYLERGNSSLVYMAKDLIQRSEDPDSGFYLDELPGLASLIRKKKKDHCPTIVIGVSFALLELAEKFPGDYSGTTFIETGGMKGRRKEMVRDELHEALRKGFNVKQIHSEYGMTELLSQAYSFGDGIFHPAAWMRVLIREMDDPFARPEKGRSGGIDIIDLANLHSCAFLRTSDIGRSLKENSFEVLGRFDHSDVRGCNLMTLS